MLLSEDEQVSQAYKNGPLGSVPIDWEKTPFSELFVSFIEYTNDLDRFPLYSLTIEDGVTAKTERYERSHLVKKKNLYKVVRPNDFVYNPMNVRFGAIARYKGSSPVAVSGYYDVFSSVHESDSVFMENFLTFAPIISYYNKVSTGSLIEKQRVHFSKFLKFAFPLPSLQERKKIAAILSTQDKVIELKEKLLAQKQQQKKYLMQQLLTGRKPHKNNPRIEECEIGEVCKINPKQDKISESQVVFLGMADISETGSVVSQRLVDFSHIQSGFTAFRRGDILIAKITPCFENGKGAYTDNLLSEHGFGSTEFHVLRTNSKVNAKYIFYHTVSEKFRKKLEREMTGSAGQKRVPAISIQKYKIFLPSSNEQNFIIEILSTADHEIDLLQKSIDAEKQKKKALMQLLLTGKVRVKI